MKGILEFALKYKSIGLYIGIGLILVFCLTYIKVLRTTNENLKLKLLISNDSIVTLQKSIDKQNENIDNLKKASDKQVAENKKTIDKAIETRKIYESKANEILKRQLPINANKCVVANDNINKEIDNEKK